MTSYSSGTKAFSLAELTAVIIVIAIISIAIILGRDILSAVELRGFISDVKSYQASIENFDSKYSQLPGDFSNAHEFFDDGTDSVCGTSIQCNGNGNERIIYPTIGTSEDIESLRLWQHLNLAEILDDNFTGIGEGVSGFESRIGSNIPTSSRSNVGYIVEWETLANPEDVRNNIIIGGFKVNTKAEAAALTPLEAFTIDKKIDDGKPLEGLVFADKDPDTSDNPCRTLTSYNVSDDRILCRMSFPILP